jgi:hypothetical protein
MEAGFQFRCEYGLHHSYLVAKPRKTALEIKNPRDVAILETLAGCARVTGKPAVIGVRLIGG